jgi:DNA-binding CsgD family transcriptional regulator/sugar-specific transcriptional regulator TrmB
MLPEARVRAGLDELVRASLLRESREHPGQVTAVSPEAGLTTLLRQREEELTRRQRELDESRAGIVETIAEYTHLKPGTTGLGAQRLLGLDAIQAHLETLTAALTSECLSVMPGGAQSQASLDASRPLDEAAAARGVNLLNLYQDSIRNDRATYDYAQWLTELGGQVRTAPILPARMVIFDRTNAILPIDPANTRVGALCISDPSIIASLVSAYEQIWAAATPLGERPSRDGGTGLTPLDQDLLRLMATGLTDEAVGNRLGLSARTVRRQMSALMARLSATSRFEAGLKAAQRGWL